MSAISSADKTTAEPNGYPVRMEGVAKSFGALQVHKDVNLTVHPRETTVVIGGSGSGKSVLLKEISGLLQPDKGSVKVFGKEIVGLKEKDLLPVRRRIGMVFQGAALFDSMNVRENVGFMFDQDKSRDRQETDELVREKLRLVHLEQAYDKMPNDLSGGMKKRVAVARAIMGSPDIILWDEPTTGLDPITADALNDLIIETQESLGITGIVITHDMTSAFKVGHCIAMLYKGEIIWTGTVEETRETDNPYVRQFIRGEAKGPITEEGKA